jgi:hypothetical protein
MFRRRRSSVSKRSTFTIVVLGVVALVTDIANDVTNRQLDLEFLHALSRLFAVTNDLKFLKNQLKSAGTVNDKSN